MCVVYGIIVFFRVVEECNCFVRFCVLGLVIVGDVCFIVYVFIFLLLDLLVIVVLNMFFKCF